MVPPHETEKSYVKEIRGQKAVVRVSSVPQSSHHHLAPWVLVEAAHPALADAVIVHPICQEELYNPAREVSINPNENSILTPQRPVPDVRLGYTPTGRSKMMRGGNPIFLHCGFLVYRAMEQPTLVERTGSALVSKVDRSSPGCVVDVKTDHVVGCVEIDVQPIRDHLHRSAHRLSSAVGRS